MSVSARARRGPALLLLLFVGLVAVASAWLGAADIVVTRGPYLNLGTPSSVVLRWRTNTAAVGRVTWGTAPGAATWEMLEAAATTEHKLQLTGLLPATTYYYTVGTPTSVTAGGDASYRFTTPPLAGTARSTRAWVVGDSGTGTTTVDAVRNAFAAWTGTRPTDLWLMLGDNAYENGTDAEYQTKVFDKFPAMLRSSVLWPALGNHDGYSANSSTQSGPYFNIFTLPKHGDAGGAPSNTEAYYSFDYGTIHFVCLDSYGSSRLPGGAMLTWLQTDLASTNQPWTIAFWHHPPYSKGSHDSDTEIELVQMRENVLPILEAAGVDLVLSGHSHSYERSYLIDGHYGTSSTFTSAMKKDAGNGRTDGTGAYRKPTFGMAPHEGTVYVVAGTSGQISGGTLNYPAMLTSMSVAGSLVLDVNGNRLDATFLDSAGARRDYFTILKGGGGIVSTPYGGTPAPIPGVIQAENFDNGGSGVAYSDTTPGNQGTVYRTTDVDVGAISGGGYYVGWTRVNEYLKFTTNVKTTGTYRLDVRVANKGTGARFHVEVDGKDVTGSLAVPDTLGYGSYQTVSKTGISLPAKSPSVVRLIMDAVSTSGGAGNFDSMQFTLDGASAPYGVTPWPVPSSTPIQAEDFDSGPSSVAYFDTTSGNTGNVYRTGTNVDIAKSSAGGYYVGWTRATEWLQYTIDVPTAGSYRLDVRVANKGSGATFHAELNGQNLTAAGGPVTVPDTTAYETFTTVSRNIQLPAGNALPLRLRFDTVSSSGGAGNVDWLKLTATTP